jgi:hypothetical protein
LCKLWRIKSLPFPASRLSLSVDSSLAAFGLVFQSVEVMNLWSVVRVEGPSWYNATENRTTWRPCLRAVKLKCYTSQYNLKEISPEYQQYCIGFTGNVPSFVLHRARLLVPVFWLDSLWDKQLQRGWSSWRTTWQRGICRDCVWDRIKVMLSHVHHCEYWQIVSRHISTYKNLSFDSSITDTARSSRKVFYTSKWLATYKNTVVIHAVAIPYTREGVDREWWVPKSLCVSRIL